MGMPTISKLLAFVVLIPLLGSSCRVWNPNRMFLTPSGYEFTAITDSLPQQIILGPGDELTVTVLTNDGYTMLTPGLESPTGGFRGQENTFELDLQGYIRLPFVDTLRVQNLNIRQAEERIEQAFKTYFREPFAQVRVLNRRAFVFGAGGGGGNVGAVGQGLVVPLGSENATLIEVLALAGGIPATGKAYCIKLVRQGPNGDYAITQINLRSIQDLNQTDVYIRHRDIIYIDPLFQTTFLNQIAGLLGLFTSVASILVLIRVFNQ